MSGWTGRDIFDDLEIARSDYYRDYLYNYDVIYIDFSRLPRDCKCYEQLIVQLKADSTPEDAIAQIKNKNYALRFQGKIREKPKYTGKILAVGISYDRKTKEHSVR